MCFTANLLSKFFRVAGVPFLSVQHSLFSNLGDDILTMMWNYSCNECLACAWQDIVVEQPMSPVAKSLPAGDVRRSIAMSWYPQAGTTFCSASLALVSAMLLDHASPLTAKKIKN